MATYADRISGMLFGVALGDALGAPLERARGDVKYTGVVQSFTHRGRFSGARESAVGQVTDDTEMTIALARALLALPRAPTAQAALVSKSRAGAVAEYLLWAGTKPPFMGRNTRALFAGIKTLAGFEGRWAAAFGSSARETWSQSNGALMRCSPLAALPERRWRALAAADAALSNPHPVCVEAELAYLAALRALLRGAAAAEAVEAALAETKAPDVREAILAGSAQKARRVCGVDKGWVLHALYAAFYGLGAAGAGFQDRIDAVVRLGGDTDTNGAIAGALLGAHTGATLLASEERTGPNLRRVMACDSRTGGIARPAASAASALPALAGSLAGLAAP